MIVENHSSGRHLRDGGATNLHTGTHEISSAVRVFYHAPELTFPHLDDANQLELGPVETAQRQ